MISQGGIKQQSSETEVVENKIKGQAVLTLSIPEVVVPPVFKEPYVIEDGWHMRMLAASSGMFDSYIAVQKGVDIDLTVEEKFREMEVDTLFLVLHGIGETFFAKKGLPGMKPFKDTIDSFRKLSLEQRLAVEKEEGYITEKRAEYLSIEWHGIVHSNELQLSKDLETITLPGIKVLRDIANEIFIDIIVYMTPDFRERIIRHVCKQLNDTYKKFCQYNPKFVANGGRVSLIGHSLGSVILFDILSSQQQQQSSSGGWFHGPADFMHLDFNPFAFVSMGSPVSFFLSVRRNARQPDGSEEQGWIMRSSSDEKAGQQFGPEFTLPTCR